MEKLVVIGLGLIGGSLALDLKKREGYKVYGIDRNPDHIEKALQLGIIDAAIDFSQIYVTTKASYIHAGNPPGIKITYRVKGQRGEIQGPPSNHAVVNDMIILP